MIESQGIVLKGDKQAEIVTETVADPIGSQVLIKTHAVGLCGSDMALYRGSYAGPKNYPIYFGHEWSGTVQAVGPQVTKFKPGHKVTGDCSIYCGACQFCTQDRNLCQQIEKFGITMDGASRQYFLHEEQYLYRADPTADLELVALSEPLAVGAQAAHRVAEHRPHLKQEKILVLGGGTIGLACLFALKYMLGCEQVELFDLVETRVQNALALGAAAPTDAAQAAAADDSYGGLYSGRGYDTIFETTAAPPAFRQAVELVRPLGTMMALGFIPTIEFSLKTITLKAAHIMGSMGGTGQFKNVLNFTRNHPQPARQLITHRLPFTDYPQAFAIAADRQQAMKVLIQF